MYNEQQKQEASKTLWELISRAIQRDAFSSVEVAAINNINHVLQSPTIAPEQAIPVESQEVIPVKKKK